jgi:hypothetical protein
VLVELEQVATVDTLVLAYPGIVGILESVPVAIQDTVVTPVLLQQAVTQDTLAYQDTADTPDTLAYQDTADTPV